jgi:hypothetical protein
MPIKVEGLAETQRALRKFDPDLYKAMNTEIRGAMKVVVSDARVLVQPSINGLYNWTDKGVTPKSRTYRDRAFPKYNADEVRKGLSYSLGKARRNKYGFSGTYNLLNKSAAGAIVETAGRLNFNGDPASSSNNKRAGAHFNRAIQGTYGGFKQAGSSRYSEGRLMYQAYTNDKGKVTDAVMHAIDKAVKQFAENSKAGIAA